MAILFLLLAGLSVSCSSQSQEQDANSAYEVVKNYEQNPLSLSLKVDRAKISIAGQLKVVVEATAPESHDVELPGRTDKLGEFTVVDFRTAQPRLTEDGQVFHTRTYVLEPFLAGAYNVPPLTVRHGEKESKASVRRQLSTEEVPIEVTSVLPPDEQSPEIKDIAGPVDMPAPWWPWIVGAVALAALAAALLWWRRRKQRQKEFVPPPLPHEVAYAELEKLLSSGLLERGEVKLFYLRLSNILRHYIEDRFGLRAPEQTTEEFLVELRKNEFLEARHKELLQRFLEHCDLVKFAELQTTRQEAETSVSLCRSFIDETKRQEKAELEPVGVAK